MPSCTPPLRLRLETALEKSQWIQRSCVSDSAADSQAGFLPEIVAGEQFGDTPRAALWDHPRMNEIWPAAGAEFRKSSNAFE
jgi:hypothetical protein